MAGCWWAGGGEVLKLYDWFWSDCLELPGYTSAVAAAVGGVAAAAVG